MVEYRLLPAPPCDERLAPWVIVYWREWLLERDKNEETLRKYTKSLTGAFQEASWRNDMASMRRVFAMHDFGYRYCRQEPLRTPWELTSMYILMILADRHVIAGRLEQALSDLAAIDACLTEGDERRKNHGMIPRPSSELRLDVLGLRAACLADPTAPVPDPAQAIALAKEFWRIADLVVAKLTSRTEASRANILTHLIQREMEICKLAYKVDSALYEDAVGRFNKRYASDVSFAPAQGGYSEASINSAWYWDMEVWKHLHAASTNEQALEQCKRARDATLEISYAKRPATCLRQYWKRQASAA